MNSGSFSCRCRACGFVLSYQEEDIGADARCPQCGQTFRFPGKLAAFATIRSSRRHEPAGLAMEIGGFLLMFVFFPWGLFAGSALVFFGWRKSRAFRCSNCNAAVQPAAPKCPHCKSSFTEDS